MAPPSPAEVFPPGEYLRDELEARGWTETEFAQILGRPVQAVSEILNAKKEITVETALSLGEALGTSPEVWLNLQNTYRLHQVRATRPHRSPVARRAHLRGLAPIAEIRRRGWITDTDDLDTIEREVCNLLSLRSIDDAPQRAVVAMRRSNAAERLTPQQHAWIGYVRRTGAGQPVASYDPTRLADLALRLPGLLRDGVAALRNLPVWLADCGVAFVAEPGLKSSKLDGAVVFTADGTPVIGVTTRWDRFDGLVYTLMHELAHLALGHVDPAQGAHLDEELTEMLTTVQSGGGIEREADRQAGEWIFPGGFSGAGKSPSVATIVGLANSYGVHPSVVIGRCQRDGLLEWSQYRNHIPKVRSALVHRAGS